MEIRHLAPDALELIAAIDRSEEVGVGYAVEDGSLIASSVSWVVPAWSRDGTGDHSVEAKIEFCRPVLDRGGVLIGAFDDETVTGLAVIEPEFERDTAWLAFLHVSRPHRRRGVATALWDETARMARDATANTIYVSATPSASAVGFYLQKGCQLAVPPHPALFALEPDDIHLILQLTRD